MGSDVKSEASWKLSIVAVSAVLVTALPRVAVRTEKGRAAGEGTAAAVRAVPRPREVTCDAFGPSMEASHCASLRTH